MLSASITSAVVLGAGFAYWHKKSNTYRLNHQASQRNLILGFGENTLKLSKAMALDALAKQSQLLWVVDTVSFGAGFVDLAQSVSRDQAKRLTQVELSPETSFDVLQAQVKRPDVFEKSLAIDLDLNSPTQCALLVTLLLTLGETLLAAKHMPNYLLLLNHYDFYRTPALDNMIMALATHTTGFRIGITLATEAIGGLSAYANLCDHIHVLDGSWNDTLLPNEQLTNPQIVASAENQRIKKGQLRYLSNTATQGEVFELPRSSFFRV